MRRHDPILWFARLLALAVLVLAVAALRTMLTPPSSGEAETASEPANVAAPSVRGILHSPAPWRF